MIPRAFCSHLENSSQHFREREMRDRWILSRSDMKRRQVKLTCNANDKHHLEELFAFKDPLSGKGIIWSCCRVPAPHDILPSLSLSCLDDSLH